jgi:dCTP deaminase
VHNGKWTLEMTVVHPLIIYPNMEICQIYYNEITGDPDITYKGKYQNQQDVVESKMYQDFK